MKKLLTKFFISLYLVLLGGGYSLHAHQGDVSFSSAIKIENLKQPAGYSAIEKVLAPDVKAATTFISKQADKIDPNDSEEEDELSQYKLVSLKKFIAVNKYFTGAFYGHLTAYLLHNIKNCLPVGEQFLYEPSSKWFIVFRVIRI